MIIDINHLMQAKSPSAILGSMSHLRDDVDPRTTIRTRMNSSVDPNMVKPYCWMCSTNEGKKTNEHIFSISLRRLAEHNEFDSHRVNAITGEGYDKRNLQKLNSLLAGNVCASCNNGWMNKLEITVTPQIIDVPNRVLTSQEVQFWIRWIAKISVMINTSQNYRVQWKASQRHYLQYGLPANMHVFVARVEDGTKYDVNWMQSIGHELLCDCGEIQPHLAEMQEFSLCNVIRIFDLCFVVVLTPPNFKIRLNHRWGIDLFPLFANGTLRTTNLWDLESIKDYVGEEVLYKIANSFELVER